MLIEGSSASSRRVVWRALAALHPHSRGDRTHPARALPAGRAGACLTRTEMMRNFLQLPLLLMLLLQPAPTVGLPGGPPVAGWSTWNTFACSINATLVKQGADHLVSSGLLAAGYNYIVCVRARTAVHTPTLCHCAARCCCRCCRCCCCCCC